MSYLQRFRDTLYSGDFTEEALFRSCTSAADFENRVVEMEKTYANLDELIDSNYSGNGGHPGYADGGLHGIDFFSANVAANIKSYVGIFSVEKNMNNPHASLPFFNAYGVRTGNVITPNIGPSFGFPEGRGDFNFTGVFTKAEVAAGLKFGTTEGGDYKLDAVPMVPRTISITYTELDGANAGAKYTVEDDGLSTFYAMPGLVKTAAVAYGQRDNNPSFAVEVDETKFTATTIEVKVRYVMDTPKTLTEKIKAEVDWFTATSAPIIIPYEVNQLTAMTVKKSLGMDMRKFVLDTVTDEYTKLLNEYCAVGIQKTATKLNEAEIDLSAFSLQAGNYNSIVQSLLNQLSMVETIMASKTEKLVTITAFMTSIQGSDIFKILENNTPKWEANKAITFIDDVVGYLDGVPVVRTKHVQNPSRTILQAFGIHKLKEGQLAPLMRGMFLPLTSMNEVGSFDNPLIKSGGIFSFEGISPLTSDLTVGFQIKVNLTGTMINRN